MAIMRHDPFREFATLQDRMHRLFGDVYLRDEDVSARGNWVPPVDYASPIKSPVANLTQMLLPSLVLGTVVAAQVMRMTRSSLLIDLSQGKRIEVESLPGSVVRRGRAVGVPTPRMEALYAVLKPHRQY